LGLDILRSPLEALSDPELEIEWSENSEDRREL
jgi:hypothetical protein